MTEGYPPDSTKEAAFGIKNEARLEQEDDREHTRAHNHDSAQ
jgi:hypothetical protein